MPKAADSSLVLLLLAALAQPGTSRLPQTATMLLPALRSVPARSQGQLTQAHSDSMAVLLLMLHMRDGAPCCGQGYNDL